MTISPDRLKALMAIADEDIDTSDIPELDHTFWENCVASNNKVLLGKPVIKGTRLSVEFLLGLLNQGWSDAEILENYPSLTPEAIYAIRQQKE